MVVSSALWIVGTAVLLAAVSYFFWRDSGVGSWRKTIARPAFLRIFWGGLTLITAGLALGSQTGWEAAIWILFTLVHLFNAYQEGLFHPQHWS